MTKPGIKLFLTGDPGCGKTTAVRKLAERLEGHVKMSGFTTGECRNRGRRSGFQGVTLDGRTFELARLGGDGPYRIGPYIVTLEGLESIGIPALKPPSPDVLVVVDEVGKMESFSEAFRQTVLTLLEGPNPVLGTVAAHGVGFVKKIRNHPGIELVRLTRKSRDGMIGEVLRRLARRGVGAGR